jgi:nucleoside-diphosphate-sugar epimerase
MVGDARRGASVRDQIVRILVTGATGMIGRKLVSKLLSNGRIGSKPISQLSLFDVCEPAPLPATAIPIEAFAGDLSDPAAAEMIVSGRPDFIFHLAAIVSGEAEQDFTKGYRVNIDGTRNLLEAVRAARYQPRLVFASSVAVFGAPLPDPIPDDFHLTPLTSYGTQKAVAELLISDYTRKSFLDGIALRLPTICVRPGEPNRAASGFFSNIIREPLTGAEAVLPVPEDVRHTHASPRAAIDFLLHAAALDSERIGPRRAITMPGISVTVGEQIAALRNVAGEEALRLIRREPSPFVERIVRGWPARFDARHALELGFRAEQSFEEIIRVHIEDELGGHVA